MRIFPESRLRLYLSVTLVSLFFTGAVGAYGYFAFRAALIERAADQLQTSARLLADRIDDVTTNWRRRITMLAERPATKALVDKAGDTVMAASDHRHFADLISSSSPTPYLVQLALADDQGTIIDATVPEMIGTSVGSADWFDDGADANPKILSGSAGDPNSLTIDMVAAVQGQADSKGLIWASLDLKPLLDELTDEQRPGQTVIARRNWRGDAAILWPNAMHAESPEIRAVRPTRLDRPIVHALREGDHLLRSGFVDASGAPVLAAARHLPELDWGLVRQQRVDEVLAPATRLGQLLTILVAALVACILATAAWSASRRRGEKVQLASQTHLVLASLADGVVTTSKRGIILTANPAAEAMFGWGTGDVVGQGIEALIPPKVLDADAMVNVEQAWASQGDGTKQELLGQKKDGTTFPIEIALNKMRIDRQTQFVIVLRDISQQREAARQIGRQAAELNQANNQLERRNEDLEKQFQAAHQFVDNVSHEFRTPLTVIKEYVQIMRDGALGAMNAEQIEFADIVLQRADDLNIMVNDMLDISKLNAGLLGISRRSCRFEAIAARCRPVLESRAKAAEIDLHFDMPEKLPELFADSEKISRIIINLAVNACKFTDEGGQIRVWARDDMKASQLIVGVTDNGPGIAPDNLKAIFERFRQVGDVRQSTKGFGLGLAITKELVDLSLGDISVESKPGEGSTFWFTIPTARPLPLLERFVDRLGIVREGASHLALMSIDAVGPAFDEVADQLDEAVLHALRSSDLCLRIASQRWLIVAALSQSDSSSLQYRLEREIGTVVADNPDCRGAASVVSVLGTWPISGSRDALRASFVQAMAIENENEPSKQLMQA